MVALEGTTPAASWHVGAATHLCLSRRWLPQPLQRCGQAAAHTQEERRAPAPCAQRGEGHDHVSMEPAPNDIPATFVRLYAAAVIKGAISKPDFVVAQLAQVDPLKALVLLASLVCGVGRLRTKVGA